MTSAHQISKSVASGEISATEVVEKSLRAIKELNPTLNAFVHVDEDWSQMAARRIDKKRERHEKLGALAGVPIAIKANIAVKGYPLSCCSKSLEGFVAPYNATVIERIIAEDGVIIGLCNMDEFAMGSSTEHSCFGATRNPWGLDRTAGGSSGGCAVAVASGFVPLAVGSDTGGSVRQPAALCGVVGMKPTYGRISRYGLVAFASSLDSIGVLSSCVDDAILLYRIINGHDIHDQTSAQNHDLCHSEIRSLCGLRIGVIEQELEREHSNDGISEVVLSVLQTLINIGAKVQRLSLPVLKNSLSVYALIAHSEASTNLARFGCGHFGYACDGSTTANELQTRSRTMSFGDEVKRRIILGAYALSDGARDRFYNRAVLARKVFVEHFNRVFEDVDLLIGPTTPTTAFHLGERIAYPLTMYKSDQFTIPASLANMCAVSIPCGMLDGLPVGLQVSAPNNSEGKLMTVARLIEGLMGFSARPTVYANSCF